MRATIFLSVFILIVHISYAQVDKINLQQTVINIEENHYQFGNNSLQTTFEIKFEEILKPTNNSEGKFPLYTLNNEQLKTEFTKDFKLKDTRSKQDKIALETNSLLAQKQIEFIENLIIKKIKENNSNITYVKEFQIKNSLNDEQSIITVDKDVLNQTYSLNSIIEIQIGKNLNNYLKKINKTELDRTLQNSLNLLAINF
ncbi:hypothetical protein FDT66_00860 [Polaribacter aestuariivivens]|uniref:Uncharacterized protein n=1 Tax=Polaribacter aestuariivivens TaxID=2304626 RepID=A0A5S3N9R7_9FLAO|nr:hypothetical protein [Polaribacter aestuariivivens]TMM32048.1 hypothetical protein FDT66_00860 [Polaribacter aestuariivivens]